MRTRDSASDAGAGERTLDRPPALPQSEADADRGLQEALQRLKARTAEMADEGRFMPGASKAHASERDPDDTIGLIDFLVVLAEHWKALVFVPLAAALLALGVTFMLPPMYTATTRVLPPQQNQSAMAMIAQQFGGLASLAGAAAGLKNPLDQFVALLGSRTVADRVIERFDLVQLYQSRYLVDARTRLAKRTELTSGKDGLITVEVEDTDPTRAAALANAYIEELDRLLKTIAITEAAQRRGFFEQQLAAAKSNLADAEAMLASSGIGESVLKAEPRAAVEGVARLKAAITAVEVRIATMRHLLSDSNPEYRQAQQELGVLRAQLAKAEKSGLATGGEAGRNDYITRYRDFKYHEMLFELLAKQFELAKIDEAREGALLQVVDTALPPERKSGPRKGLIAAVTGLVTGFLVLLWVVARQGFASAAGTPGGSGKLARICNAFRRPRP